MVLQGPLLVLPDGLVLARPRDEVGGRGLAASTAVPTGTIGDDGTELHAELRASCAGTRRPDGGFPTSAGGESELEPTALAALALDGDRRARAWLGRRQSPDGGFASADGRVDGPDECGARGARARRRRSTDGRSTFANAHRGLALPGRT